MGVRKARLKDAEAIVKINVRTWKESYKGLIADSVLEKGQIDEERISAMRRRIQNQTSTVLVYEDKEIMGFMVGGVARDERKIKNELYAIYVLPDAQHKGIGTQLLSEYKQIMKGRTFYLYTLKNNHRARSFYEKNGGILCEEFNRSITIQDHIIEEVCYIFEQ